MNLFQKLRLTIFVFKKPLIENNVIKSVEYCFFNTVKTQLILLNK